jgi:hypothetical protein
MVGSQRLTAELRHGHVCHLRKRRDDGKISYALKLVMLFVSLIINQAFYLKVLKYKDLYQLFCQRTEYLSSVKWFLHHDNSFSHTDVSVGKILAKNKISITEHPSYLLNLAPHDLFTSLKLKISLKGSHFEYAGDIQKHEMVVLKAISENYFQHVFRHEREFGT